MRKKTIIFVISISLLITPLFLFLGLPGARANGSIPSEYSDEVNLNGEYIYNVTAFGGDTAWFNYDLNASEVWKMWSTEEGGQVIVNFTGFYDRHPNDTFGFMFLKFPDQNMPYMDISITDKIGTVNISRNNCSNGEIFNNMVLGHWPFDSGFLIPNNMTTMKALAVQTANESGLEYKIEQSYSFIRFYFKDPFQETELLYNPKTGLLLEANITAGGYHLEMFLTNFITEFFDNTYQYDVSTFAGTLPIYNPDNSFAGYFFTSAGAFIQVNFTDIYSGIPHLDVNATYLRYPPPFYFPPTLDSVFYAENLSNSELSYNLLLGFDTFQPGFLIPDMNLSETKQMVIDAAEDDPGSSFDLYGELEILESDLTLKIKFDQTDGTQYTYLILEKKTGLLLSSNTGFGNYKLEMKIQGFTEPNYPESPSTPPGSDEILGFPLLLIGIVSFISFLGIGWKIKKSKHK